MREQRRLHDDERADGREEYDQHVAPRQQEKLRVPEREAGDKGRDAEHRGRGPDRQDAVPELGPHLLPNGSGGQTAFACAGGWYVEPCLMRI